MKPIIITTDKIQDTDKEIRIIADLISRHGCRVHLRKKSCTEQQLDNYCSELVKITDRRLLTLHGFPDLVERYTIGGYHAKGEELKRCRVLWGDHVLYSMSCHSMEEVDQGDDISDYLFLSPIFDSISKRGYQSNFNEKEIHEWLLNRKRKAKVIALGGVEARNIKDVKSMGFDGAALLGAVWGDDMMGAIERYETIIKERV